MTENKGWELVKQAQTEADEIEANLANDVIFMGENVQRHT